MIIIMFFGTVRCIPVVENAIATLERVKKAPSLPALQSVPLQPNPSPHLSVPKQIPSLQTNTDYGEALERERRSQNPHKEKRNR